MEIAFSVTGFSVTVFRVEMVFSVTCFSVTVFRVETVFSVTGFTEDGLIAGFGGGCGGAPWGGFGAPGGGGGPPIGGPSARRRRAKRPLRSAVTASTSPKISTEIAICASPDVDD